MFSPKLNLIKKLERLLLNRDTLKNQCSSETIVWFYLHSNKQFGDFFLRISYLDPFQTTQSVFLNRTTLYIVRVIFFLIYTNNTAYRNVKTSHNKTGNDAIWYLWRNYNSNPNGVYVLCRRHDYTRDCVLNLICSFRQTGDTLKEKPSFLGPRFSPANDFNSGPWIFADTFVPQTRWNGLKPLDLLSPDAAKASPYTPQIPSAYLILPQPSLQQIRNPLPLPPKNDCSVSSVSFVMVRV